MRDAATPVCQPIRTFDGHHPNLLPFIYTPIIRTYLPPFQDFLSTTSCPILQSKSTQFVTQSLQQTPPDRAEFGQLAPRRPNDDNRAPEKPITLFRFTQSAARQESLQSSPLNPRPAADSDLRSCSRSCSNVVKQQSPVAC